MSFEALIDKVRQAEQALEARERQTAADWRQCRASWRALWSPARLIVVGMVSGFIVGKAEPAQRAAPGGGVVQLLGALAGLFAGGSAQAAAGRAKDAAENARQTTAAVGTGVDLAPTAPLPRRPDPGPQTPEFLRAAGLL